MSDGIDRLITDIIQHANAVSRTSDVEKKIMEWKSYPAMRQAVEDFIEKREDDAVWHATVGCI